MRMRYFCAATVALLVLLGSPILADNSPEEYWLWFVYSGAVNEAGQSVSSPGMQIAASPRATDDYGCPGDSPIPIGGDPSTYAATYHENGADGWTGSTGFYNIDYRSMMAEGETKTWDMYLWATPSVPTAYDTMGIAFVNIIPPLPYYWLGCQFSLKSKPSSITDGPVVGTIWDIPAPEGAPTIYVPTYRTDNGLTGYEFEFSATAVPEPASFAMPACGLAGILARTRKRQCL